MAERISDRRSVRVLRNHNRRHRRYPFIPDCCSKNGWFVVKAGWPNWIPIKIKVVGPTTADCSITDGETRQMHGGKDIPLCSGSLNASVEIGWIRELAEVS